MIPQYTMSMFYCVFFILTELDANVLIQILENLQVTFLKYNLDVLVLNSTVGDFLHSIYHKLHEVGLNILVLCQRRCVETLLTKVINETQLIMDINNLIKSNKLKLTVHVQIRTIKQSKYIETYKTTKTHERPPGM